MTLVVLGRFYPLQPFNDPLLRTNSGCQEHFTIYDPLVSRC